MEDIRYYPGTISTRAMHGDLPEEDDEKFWIRIMASNDGLDLHNSIMDPKTTLRNFEKDAKSKPGVALKDHHAWRSFGYGRTTDAQLAANNELWIDAFILKNRNYKDSRVEFESAEDLIRSIKNDLVNQSSIGFFGAREICNLCQLPIRRYTWYSDWEPEGSEKCSHKMGKMYDVNGKRQKATYTVYDGRLKELSLVEFASNRYTSIESKREISEALRSVFTTDADPDLAASLAAGIRGYMEKNLMEDKEWIQALREKLDVPAIRSTDEPDEVLTQLEGEMTSMRQKVEDQKDEIADLQADAEDGKAFREARIEEAVKQGNRAHGDAFDEAFHREYYADLPIEQLEKQIAENKKIGDQKLPAGRATTDTHEPPKEKTGIRARMKRRRR